MVARFTGNQRGQQDRFSFAMSHQTRPVEELDLAIPDMDSETAETEVQAILKRLPGIESVRLLPRGAFVRYHAADTDKEQIITAIRQSGFRASNFQDSKSGDTGVSSQ